jgi:hypothetical protein
MAHRLRIPGIIQTRAAFEPSTFDDEKGTVEVVFTTGARGLRRSWDGPYYEELEVSERALDLSRLNNGAPYLDNHDRYGGCRSVLGVIERAWIQGKLGRALVRFSDREEVKPIRQDVKNGILRHCSVGYSVQKYEQIEKVDEVPVYRATRWQPFEISQTPIAFDDGATVRSRPEQEFQEVEVLSTVQENRTMPDPIAPASPAVAQPAVPPQLEAPVAPAAAVRAAPDSAALAAERDRAIAGERERVSQLRSLGTKHKVSDKLMARLLGDEKTPGVALEEARNLILDELATRSDALPPSPNATHQPTIVAGADERDKFHRAATAALIIRAGLGDLFRAAQKTPFGGERLRDMPLEGSEFARWSVADLAGEFLERAGQSTRGMDRETKIGRAFVYRSGMNTTSDFAIVLENLMHKTVQASYATAPNTYRLWCAIRSVADFRDHNIFRTGSLGTLDKLLESGEIKRKSIPDGEKAKIAVETYANIIGLTRRALVNDDLGVFNDLGVQLGIAASDTIENAAFAMLAANGGLGANLLDGKAVFHPDHANIGTNAAIAVESLDADAAMMATQKDVTGKKVLDLQPALLLVARALKGTANVINAAEFDPDTANKLQRPNKCRNLFKTVIGTARLTGNRRYLLADPAVAPVFAVAFLQGKEAPTIESKDGWDSDGTEWKVVLDFGTAPIDYRGGVTNQGG